MGHPAKDTSGSIRLGSHELSGLPADERAKKGMFLAFQSPEEVEGVKLGHFVRKVISSKDGEQDLDRMVEIQQGLAEGAENLGMDRSFVSREINVGCSGGEKKRLEMLQMTALRPKLVILDEIDSGLDVDGIKLIARAISELNDGTRSFLIITHYPRILKYIKPDFVHVLANGRIIRSGDESLAHMIEEKGYAWLMKK